LPLDPNWVAIVIIGLSTVNVAPATTGSRTPNTQLIPAAWMIVQMPETSRSAAISSAVWSGLRPTAGPTMSGTATAPAYMMNRCWMPRVMFWRQGSS
jgi:hypothetical protein